MCDGEEWAPRRVGAPDRVARTFPCRHGGAPRGGSECARVRALALSGVPRREKQAEDQLPFLRDGQSGRGHLRKVQGGISHTLTTRGWFGHPSWLRLHLREAIASSHRVSIGAPGAHPFLPIQQLCGFGRVA